MTSSTKNTVWALGIVAVLGFLAYKLWPALQRAINKGATSGSAGAGSAVGAAGASNAAYPGYYPQNESATQGNLLSQILSALSGGGSKSGSGISGGSSSSYPGGNLNPSGSLSQDISNILSPNPDSITQDYTNSYNSLVDPGYGDQSLYEGLGGDQMPSIDFGSTPDVSLAAPIDTSQDQGYDYGTAAGDVGGYIGDSGNGGGGGEFSDY